MAKQSTSSEYAIEVPAGLHLDKVEMLELYYYLILNRRMEDRLGKLAPGYLADLLVLAQDPFNCDPETLRTIHPIAVMVGGEWVVK